MRPLISIAAFLLALFSFSLSARAECDPAVNDSCLTEKPSLLDDKLDLVPIPKSKPPQTEESTDPLTLADESPFASGHGLAWIGGVVGISGLAVFSFGIYFGTQSVTIHGTAERAETQLETHRLNQLGSDSANTANLLLAFGGLAIAAGVIMVTLDFTVFSDKEDVSVGLDPNGASLSLKF